MFGVSPQLADGYQDRPKPHPRPVELLIVDDNLGDIRLANEAFKAAGAKPNMHMVHDGSEALRYLQREGPYASQPRPDLILLDLNLPRLTGHEVLRHLKSDPDLRRIPVIVWTTARSQREIDAVYDLHANCCVTKPLDMESFFRLIDCAQRFWFGIATLPPR